MKLYVLGGFLGAGKTTLACVAATRLRERGERVAIIVNDQGRSLVDAWRCGEAADDVHQITGGCFCCRYAELEHALQAAERGGATVVIAEAVGSCTDLVATVLAPLADRHGTLTLAPLAVVADPGRIAEAVTSPLSPDITFLFRKQLEEADVVLLSHGDLDTPDVTSILRDWGVTAPTLRVSGLTGAGLDRWLDLDAGHKAGPLQIDYDRYASAEAQLAWFNARISFAVATEVAPADLMSRFLREIRETKVAHVKLRSLAPAGGGGSIVRMGADPHVYDSSLPPFARHFTWLVNARVATEPSDLQTLLSDALERVTASREITWQDVECFRPGRPTPTHRYAQRCSAATGSSCCAAFYQRSDVRHLLGDSYHPGGIALTLQLTERLALGAGDQLLDVACGNGASLRAIRARWPIRGIGLDASAPLAQDDGIEFQAGDAHAIPRAAASVDAILCECALSTFLDQPGALREMHRVLRPGGQVAISDMVLEGNVPAALREWIHNGTCLERALSAQTYMRALADAGFSVREHWDASGALRELLLRVKRNLVAWVASATASGSALPFDVKTARLTLRAAERAVADGTVRYGAFIAQKTT